MSERLYFINNTWLTYENAHKLGYTKLPPNLLSAIDSTGSEVTVIQDLYDNTYYDSANKLWTSDFTELNLYKNLDSTITLYTSEVPSDFQCYSNSLDSSTPTHVMYSGLITDITSLYNNYGMTTYQCEPFNVLNGVTQSWHDPITDLYFNGTSWQVDPPTAKTDELLFMLNSATLVEVETDLLGPMTLDE